MRVLHVLGDLRLPKEPENEGASGIVRATLEIAKAQARLGDQVWIAAAGHEAWATEWHGVKLCCVKVVPWASIEVGSRRFDFRVHLSYMSMTNLRRFDVIHGHLYNYLRFLRARLRVAHMHNDPFYDVKDGEEDSAICSDLKTIKKHSGFQVVPSRFVAAQLERGLQSSGTVRLIYNGVDAELFDANRWRDQGKERRAQWGINSDEVVFLFAGAVVPEKGVLQLARAFARLSERTDKVHLVVAGNSSLWEQALLAGEPHLDYECRVRRALEQAYARGKVHFLGCVPAGRMAEMYVASDGVVIPSLCREAFGLVAIEALACEVPVIASDTGGLPELVNETNGILVPPGDETALEAAMLSLARNAERRRRLGQAGRDQALRFSWMQTASALRALYREGLKAKGR